ncbi:MAG: hypothetical protein LBB28_05365, partial [Synergistaceae bacterium]|nr:hypothetical protein [Synergistaceae bacterium]
MGSPEKETRNKIFNVLLKKGVVTLALILVIWQLASLFNDANFLPGPAQTLKGGWEIVENGVLFDYVAI